MSIEIRGLDIALGHLDHVAADMLQRRHEAADEIAHLLADYAKANHPWKTKTSATDTSTRGDIVEETYEYAVVALSAGMDYNVFLELARGGKWAWLVPAVEACRPRMLEILTRRLSA